MLIRITLYSLAALLLGAHFLRAGSVVFAATCVVAPCAFFFRRRYSLVLLQILAYGATGIWLVTAWQLVQMRQALGRDWALAAAILGAVALVSALAGALLNSKAMRERYPW